MGASIYVEVGWGWKFTIKEQFKLIFYNQNRSQFRGEQLPGTKRLLRTGSRALHATSRPRASVSLLGGHSSLSSECQRRIVVAFFDSLFSRLPARSYYYALLPRL